MAIILAIEAASDYCSIAIDDGDSCVQQVLPAARSHSKLMYPMLNKLMSESGYSPKQLDAVSFGNGPGSFTGLRIAAATAQGIGFANDIPLLPVSTLQGMAQQAYCLSKRQTIITLLDARMNEFYGGLYELKNDVMEAKIADFIAPLNASPSTVAISHAELLCCAENLYEQMQHNWQTAAEECRHDIILEAKYLLPKAKQLLANDKGCQADEIELVYLREQDHWKTIKQQKALKQ